MDQKPNATIRVWRASRISQYVGTVLLVVVASLLLTETWWLGELRGSAIGIPERKSRMGWWGIAQACAFLGALACNAIAVFLWGINSKEEGAMRRGFYLDEGSKWRSIFFRFCAVASITYLLATILPYLP